MEHLHQGSLGRPAFLPSCSDLLPFNHSVTLVSMNNTDDKPKVGRDWIAFVVAWIPLCLLFIHPPAPWVGSQLCGAKSPGFCADSKGV